MEGNVSCGKGYGHDLHNGIRSQRLGWKSRPSSALPDNLACEAEDGRIAPRWLWTGTLNFSLAMEERSKRTVMMDGRNQEQIGLEQQQDPGDRCRIAAVLGSEMHESELYQTEGLDG